MSPLIRNILAVVAGLVVGSVVNMSLVSVGPTLVPSPPGFDPTSRESLQATAHLLEPRHFIMPFLAHAVGTLAGALVAWRLAATHKARAAYVIGGAFLLGGIMASRMIPAPAWFVALDLVVAYIPMAWLATRLGPRVTWGSPAAPAA